MSEFVLDASAVIAFIQDEPGSDRIEPHLRTAFISTANLAEVATKLQERGLTEAEIDETLALLELNAQPFDTATAGIAGKLRKTTCSAGLSLGGRACLALAHSLGATALTTDRLWQKLDIGVAIEQIR